MVTSTFDLLVNARSHKQFHDAVVIAISSGARIEGLFYSYVGLNITLVTALSTILTVRFLLFSELLLCVVYPNSLLTLHYTVEYSKDKKR